MAGVEERDELLNFQLVMADAKGKRRHLTGVKIHETECGAGIYPLLAAGQEKPMRAMR